MSEETHAAPVGRFIPTEGGGFIDTARLYISDDGSTVELLEWSHELAANGAQFDKAQDLAAELGSDWKVASPHELTGIVNYDKEYPATDAPGIESAWYWTRQKDASSSGLAFDVYLSYGSVGWNYRSLSGRVRAVRRVRASQYLTLGL
jgi:hypothetical protein